MQINLSHFIIKKVGIAALRLVVETRLKLIHSYSYTEGPTLGILL